MTKEMSDRINRDTGESIEECPDINEKEPPVVRGSTNPAEAVRRMYKLSTGEFLIGNCFPVGDDGKIRVDQPRLVQIMPQGPGRVNFALFPTPCDPIWLKENAIIGEGTMHRGVEEQYIQATTGIQVQPAMGVQGRVVNQNGPVRQ